MRIGLDVMGGDLAPLCNIEGAVLAHNLLGQTDKIVLIGDEKIILDELQKLNADPNNFDIVHAASMIEMGEHPTKAFKSKPDSSIAKGFQMLSNGELDSFSSAGNSGAMLVGAIQFIGVLEGISRPATAASFPKLEGGINVLLDVGTNVDCKPEYLLQFAILGKLYTEHVYHIHNPKVGLLNIGTEKEKGNLLTRAAYQLLEESNLSNFVGNIESRDLLRDTADVIVCDGFIGNVVLKQTEAFFKIMHKKGYIDEYLAKFNYENYGGSPVLGAKKNVSIGHGISSAKAIKNMILHAQEMCVADLPNKIKHQISTLL